MSRLLLLATVVYHVHAFVPVQEPVGLQLRREGRTPGLQMEALDRKNADGASVSAVGSGSVVGSLSSFCGAFLLGVFFAFAPAAKAADIENGQGIFLANCAACHAGGNNAVQPDKKLKKDALETYGMYDVERIKYQVTNGKNAMPAFGERLGPDDIEDVANYVIDQANKGWP
eukprot:symbB.v1.2.004909.t1/scaffold263.1/size248082/10